MGGKVRFLALWGGLMLAAPLFATEWALVQETGGSVEVQEVQANPLPASYQVTEGLSWSAGVELDRTWALRGGLTVRKVEPSPLVGTGLYLGYQGWGWTVAIDGIPWQVDTGWGRWSLGASAEYRAESLEYPGLFRSFGLRTLSGALAAGWEPPDTRGLGFRVRLPLRFDDRPGFDRRWRTGLEASIVLRGTWGTEP